MEGGTMQYGKLRARLTTLILIATTCAALQPAHAQKKPAPVKSLRVYLFDCGLIQGLKPDSYNIKAEGMKTTDMAVSCYLIVHPKGTLMWDVGIIPDSDFKSNAPVVQPHGSQTISSSRP